MIPRSRAYTVDGRQFLHETNNTFDIIAFDAFGGSGVPFHLLTQEVFELASRRLNNNGVLGINIIADGWDSLLIHSVLNTLEQVFPHVIALPTSKNKEAVQNIIMFASDLDIADKLQRSFEQNRIENALYRDVVLQAYQNLFTGKPHGMVLTDNHNPSDLWADEINFKTRSAKNKTIEPSLLW